MWSIEWGFVYIGLGSDRKIIVNIYNLCVTLVSLDSVMKLGRRTPYSKILSISQPPIATSLESIPTSNSRGWIRIEEWLTWFMMMVMVFLPFMAFVISASAAPDLFPSGNYCFCHTSGCQPQYHSPSCFSIPFQQSYLPLLVHQCITKPQIALPCAFKFLRWF